jgi:hypothetical protein
MSPKERAVDSARRPLPGATETMNALFENNSNASERIGALREVARAAAAAGIPIHQLSPAPSTRCAGAAPSPESGR